MDNYYDEISAGYNNLYKDEQILKSKFIFQNFSFNFEGKTKIKVIDVGCGTGISSLLLLQEISKQNSNIEIEIFMVDPSQGLLDKIIVFEQGVMGFDDRENDPNFTIIDLNKFDNPISFRIINLPAEELDQFKTEFDFVFSLTALQNAIDLDKAINCINNLNSRQFIISFLYRGIEDQLDDIEYKMKLLNFNQIKKDNKDIYFIK